MDKLDIIQPGTEAITFNESLRKYIVSGARFITTGNYISANGHFHDKGVAQIIGFRLVNATTYLFDPQRKFGERDMADTIGSLALQSQHNLNLAVIILSIGPVIWYRG